MTWVHHLLNDLYIWTGSKGSGSIYGFVSGFGSDIGEVTIIGAIFAAYRHRVCGVKWCPWIGIHPVDGTHHRTCHIHSTLAKHQALRIAHAAKYPDQHKFMKGLL